MDLDFIATRALPALHEIIATLVPLLTLTEAATDKQTKQVMEACHRLKLEMVNNEADKDLIYGIHKAHDRMAWANVRVNLPEQQRMDMVKAYGALCFSEGAMMRALTPLTEHTAPTEPSTTTAE